ATPLWAGTVALINQDLKQKGLREAGFANPALYWMGENTSKLSPKPFHDVTAGNNLGFDAASVGISPPAGEAWTRPRWTPRGCATSRAADERPRSGSQVRCRTSRSGGWRKAF